MQATYRRAADICLQFENTTLLTFTLRFHRTDFLLQPEKFDPDRFLPELVRKRPAFSYMPFGLGPKQCLGIRLAQIEMKMALIQILQRVKFAKKEDSTGELKFRAATILQPHSPVLVKVVARSPCN